MVAPGCAHARNHWIYLSIKSIQASRFYGDSALIGWQESIDWCNMTNEIHEKECCTKPLTEVQNASNRQKLKKRARVEYFFGFMTNSMRAMYIRTNGQVREEAKIGLTNLTDNLMRCAQRNEKVHNAYICS